jgi:hypothetical protein
MRTRMHTDTHMCMHTRRLGVRGALRAAVHSEDGLSATCVCVGGVRTPRVLEECQPEHIIVYDADLTLMREIEVPTVLPLYRLTRTSRPCPCLRICACTIPTPSTHRQTHTNAHTHTLSRIG